MRLLFATTAGVGHFGPLAPFALAAVDAGHDVIVAAPGGFERTVREGGFEFWPLGERSQADAGAMFARIGAAGSFEAANMVMLRDGFAGIVARAALPAMLSLFEAWRPDVVVREAAEFSSLAAARRHGIPHVRVATGLVATDGLILDAVAGPVGELLAEAGADAKSTTLIDEPLLSLTPASFEPPEHRALAHRFRAERVTHTPSAPAHPQAVYVTFGSEAASQGYFPLLYRTVIGALADLDVDLVVAAGRAADPAGLGPVPPRVRVEQWVDQGLEIASAQAVVHHGGYGTLLGALAAGVPQIAMPLFSIDQQINAERVTKVGAGLMIGGAEDLPRLPGPSAEGPKLRTAVASVLATTAYRERSEAFARDIAALPAANEAIALIEALARA